MKIIIANSSRHPENGALPGRRRIRGGFFGSGARCPAQNDVLVIRALIAALLLSALALAGCSKLKLAEPIHTNPVDPEFPGYVEPGAELVGGPAEGGTVTTANVTFRWRRLGAARQFQYRKDTLAWSSWRPDTSVTLTGLQEGPRRFQVRASDSGGYMGSTIATRNYTMNRYYNTVMIYPLIDTVHLGDTVQFVCELEDMGTTVSAVEMVMLMNLSYLDTITASADTGYHWRSNNGTPIGPLFSSDVTNYIKVALGVAGGSPAGVSGSGRIFKIKAVARQTIAQLSVQMDSLIVRDTLNNAVSVMIPSSSMITIQNK